MQKIKLEPFSIWREREQRLKDSQEKSDESSYILYTENYTIGSISNRNSDKKN